MASSFILASTPLLYVGTEKISILPSVVKPFGSHIVLVTGAKSFLNSPLSSSVLQQLEANNITWKLAHINNEPSPSLIDSIVTEFDDQSPSCIVAIGGGSVLDAGKAISAMIPLRESVMHYLEGVGIKPCHPGVKIPFIAIPTTAGTGSEATKNAVLSAIGKNGFKRSLRHNNFVPNVAILDPSLAISCPPHVTAYSGMDAFTQLMESYLSTAANPVTDALALEGLNHIASSLMQAWQDGSDIHARMGMSLAAYLSGITLANAGLGLVHGFASAIGGYFEIPHGVICSRLMAPSNKVTVRKLRHRKTNEGALHKYARVGRIFSSADHRSNDYYIDSFLDLIEKWTNVMRIPRLGDYNITMQNYSTIIASTDNKNNPIAMEQDEMAEILAMAQ